MIATLNYDNTIEIVAKDMGIQVDDCLTNNGGVRFNDSSQLSLVKLHGSLNWRIEDPWKIHVTEAPEAFTRLIFGSVNKLRVDGPFLDLFIGFRKALESVTEIDICGYSFRDSHINYALLSWLSTNEDRRIHVFSRFAEFERVRDAINSNTGFALPTHQKPTPAPAWLRSRISINQMKASEWASAFSRNH